MLLCVSLLIAQAQEKGDTEMKGDFYVSTDGSDKNPGTKAKPFATIEKARDAVHALIKKGLKKNIKVVVFYFGLDQFRGGHLPGQ